MATDQPDALVVGAGPAGLMAAETLAASGRRVLVAEAKPSIGRKLLMAGKSGLNLTRDEPPAAFAAAYPEGGAALAPILAGFGPAEVVAWARGLGIETFAGSSGRVFPVAMKASPLLRAWAARLAGLGVAVRPRWRWTGWQDGALAFATPEGEVRLRPRATVLALGGGSWARLGSDGAWTATLAAEGVSLAPFRPSNVGFRVAWSAAMARHFGAAVKPVRLRAGDLATRGEFVVSARGVEGGGVYALGPALRAGAPLVADLAPDLDAAAVAARLARPRGGASLANHLRRALGLSPVKIALLREFAAPALADPAATAAAVKALPLRLDGPRPIDEAISTAGGLAFAGLDPDLMLRARPGVFAAGEMLDWDAPTGGYLLTACFATGRHAGAAAARWSAPVAAPPALR
ncbi:TIGR03862 family flavoprotein [Amaricoccus sp.]|uniref:TIGR03862 family flavoprotein n=1 Tax=Amaricoccus sp. TaxID=1872485 RepID=UPI0025BC3905|nr:TIGR03862 family flavoprotein [Amaricoccus sp.]